MSSLAVTEGTGEYAGVESGSGSLDATSDPEGTPQFVGTIGLTFWTFAIRFAIAI